MKLYVAFVFFIFGLYFCLTYSHKDLIEQFENKPDPNIPEKCYNLLVQKGDELHLVNTKKAIIPGVNPIKFKDLGDYILYLKWQQKMGIDCPVLFFRTTYDTQGKVGYRLLDDPLNPQGGVKSELLHSKGLKWRDELLDASTEGTLFNKNQYAGFDPQDQHIGDNTILDEKHITGGRWNPMQSDWDGIKTSTKYAKTIEKSRTRSVDDLLNPIHDNKKFNKDRMLVQDTMLKSKNTRNMTRRKQNDLNTENNEKNKVIKEALKKNNM
tara:strand:+ start:8168 stop:8968 length:801 start_codon:yes stop_codon:yes gene_type:complete